MGHPCYEDGPLHNYVIIFDIFKQFPELVYGFSQKADGPMRRNQFQEPDNAITSYLSRLNISPERFIIADLVQGSHMEVVTFADGGKLIPSCDGLVTVDKNIFLGITAADCLPVYFYEGKKKIIGIVHAGWRGIAKSIAVHALGRIISLGGSLDTTFVAIGPGIQQHHFEIGADVLPQFKDYKQFINNKQLVNLPGIIRQQLTERGVLHNNIELSADCTYCEVDRYFSFRRDKPEKAEPMLAFIGLLQP